MLHPVMQMLHSVLLLYVQVEAQSSYNFSHQTQRVLVSNLRGGLTKRQLRAISSARKTALFPHSGPTLSSALQVHLRLPNARGGTMHVGDRYARSIRIDHNSHYQAKTRRENKKILVNYKYYLRTLMDHQTGHAKIKGSWKLKSDTKHRKRVIWK